MEGRLAIGRDSFGSIRFLLGFRRLTGWQSIALGRLLHLLLLLVQTLQRVDERRERMRHVRRPQ